jgi:hypothetical protein
MSDRSYSEDHGPGASQRNEHRMVSSDENGDNSHRVKRGKVWVMGSHRVKERGKRALGKPKLIHAWERISSHLTCT